MVELREGYSQPGWEEAEMEAGGSCLLDHCDLSMTPGTLACFTHAHTHTHTHTHTLIILQLHTTYYIHIYIHYIVMY